MFSRELIESCIASPAEVIEALLIGEMHEYEEDGSIIKFYLYRGKILITNIEMKEKQMSLDVSLMLTNEEVFSYNITHNLKRMADAVGFYKHLWRPEELGITAAKELIEPLTEGLHKLKSQPKWFSTFNPSNGWGSYDGLVRFVENYLEACKKYPDSIIEVSR